MAGGGPGGPAGSFGALSFPDARDALYPCNTRKDETPTMILPTAEPIKPIQETGSPLASSRPIVSPNMANAPDAA